MKNYFLSQKAFIAGLCLWILVGSLNGQTPVITHPVVEKIWGDFNFVEGPLWIDTLGLLFSDIPENKVYRWSLDSTISVYLTPSGNSNGLALDQQGRILLAQHGPRQVSRLEENGTLTPIATHYNEKRLNSPNDIAVKSDGSVFFTDPTYGLNDQGGTSELGYNGIYRISLSGAVQLLDNTLNMPNGIAFSPDESVLYVSDCATSRIYAWDVIHDTVLANKRQFAIVTGWGGCTDGMKVDTAGYIYSTGPSGIWIYAPDGTFIQTIAVPETATNCGWGGTDRTVLYVTSGKSIYRIRKGESLPSGVTLKDKVFNNSALSCFPNPFNDDIRFGYTLDKPGRVTMQVFNTSGQSVVTLVDQVLTAGYYTILWNAGIQPSGKYFLKATLPGNQEIMKGIVKK